MEKNENKYFMVLKSSQTPARKAVRYCCVFLEKKKKKETKKKKKVYCLEKLITNSFTPQWPWAAGCGQGKRLDMGSF